MTWIYLFPMWLFYAIVVGSMCVFSAVGLAVYRRLAPSGDEVSHNDVAGPIFATIGTVLAVFISFTLVDDWQEYDQAGTTVAAEVGAVADLDHASYLFPAATGAPIRLILHRYVDAVVQSEWPAMRQGGQSEAARQEMLVLMPAVMKYNPQTNAQQTLQQSALSLALLVQDSRRNRLADNATGLPLYMWGGMLFLTIVTIVLSYVFHIRNKAMHYAMTVALASVIGTTLVLLAEVDYPFRGDVQQPPDAFVTLQQYFVADCSGVPLRTCDR
jgi:hypothetical protein